MQLTINLQSRTEETTHHAVPVPAVPSPHAGSSQLRHRQQRAAAGSPSPGSPLVIPLPSPRPPGPTGEFWDSTGALGPTRGRGTGGRAARLEPAATAQEQELRSVLDRLSAGSDQVSETQVILKKIKGKS